MDGRGSFERRKLTRRWRKRKTSDPGENLDKKNWGPGHGSRRRYEDCAAIGIENENIEGRENL